MFTCNTHQAEKHAKSSEYQAIEFQQPSGRGIGLEHVLKLVVKQVMKRVVKPVVKQMPLKAHRKEEMRGIRREICRVLDSLSPLACCSLR